VSKRSHNQNDAKSQKGGIPPHCFHGISRHTDGNCWQATQASF
jgi:hypothetical protein